MLLYGKSLPIAKILGATVPVETPIPASGALYLRFYTNKYTV